MNVEEIMSSMKIDMEKYKTEYEELGKELTSVANEYQEKIDSLGVEQKKLLEEGNKKLEDIKFKRERISGMHAGLYNQYMLLSQKLRSNKDLTDNLEKDGKSVSDINTEKKKRTTRKATELSEEEKAIIKKVTPQVKPSVDVQSKDEIPEYLREEYKK